MCASVSFPARESPRFETPDLERRRVEARFLKIWREIKFDGNQSSSKFPQFWRRKWMSAFGWVFAMVYLTNKQGKGQCCRGLFKAIRLLPQTPTAGPISFFRTDCVIIWYKSRRISSWYRMRNYSRDLLTATIWNIVRPIRSSKIIETVHRREKYCFANFKKRKEKRKETIMTMDCSFYSLQIEFGIVEATILLDDKSCIRVYLFRRDSRATRMMMYRAR